MKSTCEMRFAGSGGQGVILLSVIIAEAAVLDGMNAAQTQSYGPEARGGVCRAETIISRQPIKYTRVRIPDVLLVLNQDSFARYGRDVRNDGIIIADMRLSVPDGIDENRVIKLDLTGAAKDAAGRAISANIAAAGALNSCLGFFSEKSLEEAVMRHIPKGTEEPNLRALRAGMALVKR